MTLFAPLLWFLALSPLPDAGALPFALPPAHPFYVSFTEVNHNAAEKSLEVSCKFFADDFEKTIETAYKKTLDVTAEKDKAAFDRYIPDYIGKRFTIAVDGKPAALKYVGFEKEAESVYCYFEVTNVTGAKRLDFSNSLLYDFSKEQINVIHATVNGVRKSGKVSYPETAVGYQW